MRQLFELCSKDRDIRFSPFTWAIRMSLLHKGLEYEGVPRMFLEKEEIEAAGFKTFPTLKDGDVWVNDSLMIAHYLERTYPDKPLFGGEMGIAQSFLIQSLIGSQVMGPLFPLIAVDVCNALPEDQAGYFRESRTPLVGAESLEAAAEGRDGKIASIQKGWNGFRTALKAQPFLSGDGPAYADYTLFGAFQWCRVVSAFEPWAGDQLITDWLDRMLDLYGGEGRRAPRIYG